MQNSIFHRAAAAFSALAFSLTLMVGYFASAEVQAASAILA